MEKLTVSKLLQQSEENSRRLERFIANPEDRDNLNLLRCGLDKVTEGLCKRRRGNTNSDSSPQKRRKHVVAAVKENDYVKNWIFKRRLGFPNHERFLSVYQDTSNERTSSVTAYIPSVGFLSRFGKITRVTYPMLTRERWLDIQQDAMAEKEFIKIWCQATRIGIDIETEDEEVTQLLRDLYKKSGATVPSREWDMIRRIVAYLLPGRYKNEMGKLRFTNFIKQLCINQQTCENYWEDMIMGLQEE